MFNPSKLLQAARSGASHTHARYVGGAATLAVAAALTAGAFVTDEPANADTAAVTKSATESAATESSTESQAPAPALPEEPAPAPAPAPVVEEVAPEPVVAPPPPAPVYENNLDGWVRQSLDILSANNIPASYDGIMRNIMRESTGNPAAINLWDSNAAAGIPSKGLLQVIDPTYAAYHVAGTPFDIWDPVSNIVAACNYAAQKYGSMDNVNGAY